MSPTTNRPRVQTAGPPVVWTLGAPSGAPRTGRRGSAEAAAFRPSDDSACLPDGRIRGADLDLLGRLAGCGVPGGFWEDEFEDEALDGRGYATGGQPLDPTVALDREVFHGLLGTSLAKGCRRKRCSFPPVRSTASFWPSGTSSTAAAPAPTRPLQGASAARRRPARAPAARTAAARPGSAGTAPRLYPQRRRQARRRQPRRLLARPRQLHPRAGVATGSTVLISMTSVMKLPTHETEPQL